MFAAECSHRVSQFVVLCTPNVLFNRHSSINVIKATTGKRRKKIADVHMSHFMFRCFCLLFTQVKTATICHLLAVSIRPALCETIYFFQRKQTRMKNK